MQATWSHPGGDVMVFSTTWRVGDRGQGGRVRPRLAMRAGWGGTRVACRPSQLGAAAVTSRSNRSSSSRSVTRPIGTHPVRRRCLHVSYGAGRLQGLFCNFAVL